MQGQIIDFDSTVPVAFAKITYNNKTIASDWEGKFSIEIVNDNKPLICSYKGYYDKSYYLSKGATFLLIKMVSNEVLKTPEIYSDNLVNQLIKKVIDNKKKNQPEKALSSFEYKNYEYLLVTANPDSITSKIDTIVKKKVVWRT